MPKYQPLDQNSALYAALDNYKTERLARQQRAIDQNKFFKNYDGPVGWIFGNSAGAKTDAVDNLVKGETLTAQDYNQLTDGTLGEIMSDPQYKAQLPKNFTDYQQEVIQQAAQQAKVLQYGRHW